MTVNRCSLYKQFYTEISSQQYVFIIFLYPSESLSGCSFSSCVALLVSWHIAKAFKQFSSIARRARQEDVNFSFRWARVENAQERETYFTINAREWKELFFFFGKLHHGGGLSHSPSIPSIPIRESIKKITFTFIFPRFLFFLFLLSSLHMSLDCSASQPTTTTSYITVRDTGASHTHTQIFFDVFGSVGNGVLHNLYCHIKDSRHDELCNSRGMH